MYDRVLGVDINSPSLLDEVKIRNKKGERRRGKLEITASSSIGYKANDMGWWEKKDHGSCSVTAEFYDHGHINFS
jgi:hypothetical protein